MATIAEARARDEWVRDQTIKRIRDRIKAGPPGWEDITKQGLHYHESKDSFDVDWVIAILNDVVAVDEQAKADRVRDQLTKALR